MLACVLTCLWLFATLWTIANQALLPWNSSSKSTWVGYHALLQGIFLTQGSNPHLLHPCIGRQVVYHQCHLGSLISGIFRSLICFELYGVRECFNFILLHVEFQFSQHHSLKRLFSPLYILASFVIDESTMCCASSQSCLTLCDPADCSSPGSSVPGDSPGKNTGVDCHALLLQGIFATQGLNGLPHCRQILYQLNHQGSPGGFISELSVLLHPFMCL